MLENLKGCGQRFRAEVSSSRISQLKFEVTKGIPAIRALLSSLSWFLQVQSLQPTLPAFPFLSRQRHLWVGEGLEVLWPQVPSVSSPCGQSEPPDVVQGDLSLLPVGLLTSAGRCHQQSHRADGAGSGGSATDTP